MKDKLVTLAIRTFHRAQMIKQVLEDHLIETEIHNINLEQPEIAVGMRVRIKESDLPLALKIIEDMESEWEAKLPKNKNVNNQILVPIDFRDAIPAIVDFGFYFAERISAKVTFLYVYFSPIFTISSNNEVSTYSISDSEMLRKIVENAKKEERKLKANIRKRIKNGTLPPVDFDIEIIEGVAEDQIIDYCKKHKPTLVVMGTHGKNVSKELIGSVTAEVIESSLVPVFAVPADSQFVPPNKIKRIAFLTNFDQKDLIAIDRTISLIGASDCEIYFIHASNKKDSWDEVMLAGIETYFSNHYAKLKISYELIDNSNSLELIDDYLHKNNICVLAFNMRRRNFFARLFNPSLAYKMVLKSDTPLFVLHV